MQCFAFYMIEWKKTCYTNIDNEIFEYLTKHRINVLLKYLCFYLTTLYISSLGDTTRKKRGELEVSGSLYFQNYSDVLGIWNYKRLSTDILIIYTSVLFSLVVLNWISSGKISGADMLEKSRDQAPPPSRKFTTNDSWTDNSCVWNCQDGRRK